MSSNTKMSLVLKGMAMGVAEIIPGVSGGTIAFITGIYEELINSIKSFGPEAIVGFKNYGFKGLWTAINGNFLLWLFAGMAVGILCGIFGITYLLEHFPEPLWAFFFGLILASALYIGKQIENWNLAAIIGIITGAVVAFTITTISPAEGSMHLGYVFLSGTIAISALLLPGISGSFILLIMGMYSLIVSLLKDTLSTFDLSGIVTIGVFALGCLTGLLGFSRVLSWLFKNYKNTTMAVLTGFLIGALNKVWPWRNITAILDKETGNIEQIASLKELGKFSPDEIKILSETNVMPAKYLGLDPWFTVCIITFLLGMVVVLGLEKLGSKS